EKREHLESDVGLQPGLFHVVAEPRPLESLTAEGVAARPGKGMPVGHGEAQVVFHALTKNHLVLVVETVGKRIGGIRSLIPDRRDVSKESRAHAKSSSSLIQLLTSLHS